MLIIVAETLVSFSRKISKIIDFSKNADYFFIPSELNELELSKNHVLIRYRLYIV